MPSFCGTQFCPKIIRGHGVKLFENICLVLKCVWNLWMMERVNILEVDNKNNLKACYSSNVTVYILSLPHV